MKYCLRYYRESKSIKRYDEISIIYENQTILDLEDFIKKYEGQRIIINITLNNFIEKRLWMDIDALYSKYPNIAVCFIIYNNHLLTEEEKGAIANLSAPYFFSTSIATWDQLHYYLNLGASDVYVTEDLGFDIEAVARIVHEHNVIVRVYPNVAQSSVKETPGLRKFFIRPEDVELYAPYIDVFEFWGEISRQDILFHIYSNLKKWFGNLNELILDLNYDIDSRSIFPIFAQFRLNCRKDCLRGAKKCHICNAIDNLSKTLSENNYIFTTKKND